MKTNLIYNFGNFFAYRNMKYNMFQKMICNMKN